MTHDEWTKHRAKFREQVQRENTEAMDAGRGVLPLNIGINDAILRDILDRLVVLESKGGKK